MTNRGRTTIVITGLDPVIQLIVEASKAGFRLSPE
jgi:hypothetical protein